MQDFLERAGCHIFSKKQAVIYRKPAIFRKPACHFPKKCCYFNLKIFAQAPGKILAHAQDKICTYLYIYGKISFHTPISARNSGIFPQNSLRNSYIFYMQKKLLPIYKNPQIFGYGRPKNFHIYNPEVICLKNEGCKARRAHFCTSERKKFVYVQTVLRFLLYTPESICGSAADAAFHWKALRFCR